MKLRIAPVAFAIPVLAVLTGCQTWSSGMPMQGMSRVPPPGTGTYTMPTGYYNTSSLAPTSEATYAATNPTPNGALPATEVSPVVPAQFTAPNTYSAGAQSASGFVPAQNFNSPSPEAGASVSFSDGSSYSGSGFQAADDNSGYSEAPSLDWQP